MPKLSCIPKYFFTSIRMLYRDELSSTFCVYFLIELDLQILVLIQVCMVIEDCIYVSILGMKFASELPIHFLKTSLRCQSTYPFLG